MPSESDLITSIEHSLMHMHAYSMWTIGLTDDAAVRHKQLNFPPFWRHWRADSPAEAQEAYAYFVDKGMKPDASCPPQQNPTHVYLY